MFKYVTPNLDRILSSLVFTLSIFGCDSEKSSSPVVEIDQSSFEDMKMRAQDVSKDLVEPEPCESDCPWPKFSGSEIVFTNIFDFEGTSVTSIAADPSVIHTGFRYEMFFTCINYGLGDPPPTQLCSAFSSDGRNWTQTPGPFGGGILSGEQGSGAFALEGVDTVYLGVDGYALFYSTYPESANADPVSGYPATLRLATGTSVNGPFVPLSESPLRKTPSGPDHDAIYSPSSIQTSEGWQMVYAGHCFPRQGVDCPLTAGGVSLLFAKSPNLFGPWVKIDPPVFGENRPEWAGIMVAEPSLVKDQDFYYMFITGFIAGPDGEKPNAIGMVRSRTLDGPWEWNPVPIIEKKETEIGVVAPSVVVRDGKFQLWYTSIDSEGIYRIAYSESN